MNEDIDERFSLIGSLELGTVKKVVERVEEKKEEIEEGYQAYKAPAVGKPHPVEPNLISAGDNGWGWFNTEKMEFTKDVPRINEESLKDVFRMAAWLGADEIFIQDDEGIRFEVPGRIVAVTNRVISRTEIQEMFSDVVGGSIPSKVSGGHSVKFAFTIPWTNKNGEAKFLRFRGNGTPTIGTNGATEGCTYTIRKLGDEPPLYEKLNFLPYLDAHLFPLSGMVVFAGETSSGKTTAIGGILRKIVSNPQGGVLATYENPVEFEYRSVKHKNFIVGQTDMSRSLDGDFAEACEDAMRRTANVLLIGEVLNEATARGCVNLAQSAHAVYTTFHAGSPMDYFNRWLGMFPAEEHETIRNALISSLNVILCVRLLNTIDGGRVQIRGSFILDDRIRSKLRACKDSNFIATVKEIYEAQGNTMRDDLRRNRARLSRETYKEYMYTFEGGHNDAEEIYPNAAQTGATPTVDAIQILTSN